MRWRSEVSRFAPDPVAEFDELIADALNNPAPVPRAFPASVGSGTRLSAAAAWIGERVVDTSREARRRQAACEGDRTGTTSRGRSSRPWSTRWVPSTPATRRPFSLYGGSRTARIHDPMRQALPGRSVI